jgi:hypothetical protein
MPLGLALEADPIAAGITVAVVVVCAIAYALVRGRRA